MSGWLGNSGYSREAMTSLSDAYKSMYENLEQAKKNVGADSCWDGYKAKGTKKKGGKDVPNCVKEEELPEEYSVSDENHVAIMEGKKKCKDGYYYCSDEKKCKKEKSNKTTVIVGGRYGYGGGGSDDDDDKDGGDGGDGGGGDGGGGGGE